MLKNKTQTIIFGALATTILLHFQRVIMVLVGREGFAANIGVTFEAVLLRMLFFFTYACLVLSFNIIWKEKWEAPFPWRRVFNITTNFGLFLVGVIMTTVVMANFLSGSLENKQVFVIITTDFLIVHPILLLLARFVNLNFQQQQIILEKEQAKQSALRHQLEALRSQINQDENYFTVKLPILKNEGHNH